MSVDKITREPYTLRPGTHRACLAHRLSPLGLVGPVWVVGRRPGDSEVLSGSQVIVPRDSEVLSAPQVVAPGTQRSCMGRRSSSPGLRGPVWATDRRRGKSSLHRSDPGATDETQEPMEFTRPRFSYSYRGSGTSRDHTHF